MVKFEFPKDACGYCAEEKLCRDQRGGPCKSSGEILASSDPSGGIRDGGKGWIGVLFVKVKQLGFGAQSYMEGEGEAGLGGDLRSLSQAPGWVLVPSDEGKMGRTGQGWGLLLTNWGNWAGTVNLWRSPLPSLSAVSDLMFIEGPAQSSCSCTSGSLVSSSGRWRGQMPWFLF